MSENKTRKKINSTLNSGAITNAQIKYNKTTLPNGIRVISEEIPTVESYSLGIFINTGSRNDPKGKEGLAHFLEHSLFRHTKTRSSRIIASEFESVGAYTNAFTTKEHLCFYVRALKPHFRKTFSLLADLVLNPLFLKKDIEKERDIILEEIKSYEDDPEEMIFDEIDKLLFAGHPLGSSIAGYSDSVKEIQCEDLESFHYTQFIPQNIVIASSGNIPHDKVVNYSEFYFSQLVTNNNLLFKKFNIPDYLGLLQTKEPARVETEKQFNQSHLMLARLLPGINSFEKYPLAILNIILGDGMSSRLNHQIREKHGLAYNVESSIQLHTDTGGFYIYAAMEPSRCKKVESLILKQMMKLIDSDISLAEITRAKEQLKSSTVMALESMSNRMQSLAKSELMMNKYEDVNTSLEIIDSISSVELKLTAQKYLDPMKWGTVLFYPEEE
jgi:predicted Zn-dependent peptidase